MKDRPSSGSGSTVTTPTAAALMQLTGGGIRWGNVAVTRDEHRHLQRLYGYVDEQPNERPPAPELPPPLSYKATWEARCEHDKLQRAYEAAAYAHEVWTDPRGFQQAGADRNLNRHVEADGVRLVAWLAKHLQPGEDPLKQLVRLAVDAGWDVDGSDVAWADPESVEGEDDDGADEDPPDHDEADGSAPL